MNDLQIFTNAEFTQIRTLEEDGRVLFCAKDVAVNLGYGNTREAIQKHCKGVVKRDALTSGGMQEMAFISEPDVYRLIMRSKLPAAQRFEHWIMEEILPTIRKHGIYATGETLEALIRDPQFGIRLLSELQAEREQRRALERENEQSKRALGEMEPKARYCERVLQSRSLVPVSTIAKDYGMSAVMFNRMLHELGVQYRLGDTWLLYQKYADQGYAHSQTHILDNGYVVVSTCWTQKVRLFLYAFLKERMGLLPVIERDCVICER